MKKDKYYYFPTMTKNIALVRDEKYIINNKIYTLIDFKNNSYNSPILFQDNNKKILRMSCFDIGSIISLKKQRKNKIKKINENN